MTTTAFARAGDPLSSHLAAASIALTKLEEKVLRVLIAAGASGRTVDELVASTGMEKVTVSPRLRPLCGKGLALDSGITRAGKSGRGQTVWVAAPGLI